MRQRPMYFPLDDGRLSGVARPGEIVWSCVFLMDGALHVDLGRGTVVEDDRGPWGQHALAREELRRIGTAPWWPGLVGQAR